MTDIGDHWYMEKMNKGLPPIRRKKLIIIHKRKIIKLKVHYILLIVVGIIGNSNYIGKILSGLIQEVEL